MKTLSVLLIAAFLLQGCSSQQKRISIDDPFSDQLAYYYKKQQQSKTALLASALAFSGSFAAGTYFATSRSLGKNSARLNNAGLFTAYPVSAASFGFGIWSFIKWSGYVDAYLETLRLQTQYYNVVQP